MDDPVSKEKEAAGGEAPADEVLARRAARGEEAAFETLVLRYQDRIYGLLARLTGSSVEAEDLSQETFFKAFRAVATFKQEARFSTWLFSIAINSAYSRGRQLSRRRAREGVSLDGARPVADEEAGMAALVAGAQTEEPGWRMEQEELRQQVRAGLDQLDPDYRTVLLLREVEGFDYRGIAEVLALSRAAVKSRLHRARLELARLLKPLNPQRCRMESRQAIQGLGKE